MTELNTSEELELVPVQIDKCEEKTASTEIDVLHDVVQTTEVLDHPFQILTSNGTTQILNAEALQTLEGVVITVAGAPGLEDQHIENFSDKIWQVIPTSGNAGIAHIIAVGQSDASTLADIGDAIENEIAKNEDSESEVKGINLQSDTLASMLLLSPITNSNLPPDAPSWALKLRDCEIIGDSYRGWVSSEPELDLILTFHKQQTQSYWGTRQSPSSSRQSTRLMWKSQYVPFDGIPFINSGSRAVVMECQYGPRRKGNPVKKQNENANSLYKQTCPARIYVKKVRKYLQYMVDMNADRKSLRTAMDHAFQELKTRGYDDHGEDRWYVQLPTIAAHEFHDATADPKHAKKVHAEVKKEILPSNDSIIKGSRMHPKLAEKIRELVVRGEREVYAIRKELRKYVEHGMFDTMNQIPERHNLSFFPTVHDIQNHIYQTLKDAEEGNILINAPRLLMDCDSETSCDKPESEDSVILKPEFLNLLPSLESLPSTETNSLPQSLTVTFSQPQQGEQHVPVISKIEAHLNDGTMQVSSTLTAETIELLSRHYPELLTSAGVQLETLNVQSDILSHDNGSSQISVIETSESDAPSAMLTDMQDVKMESDLANDESTNDEETLELLCSSSDVNKKVVIITAGVDGKILHVENPLEDV